MVTPQDILPFVKAMADDPGAAGPLADYLMERGATLENVLSLYVGTYPLHADGLPQGALAVWLRHQLPGLHVPGCVELRAWEAVGSVREPNPSGEVLPSYVRPVEWFGGGVETWHGWTTSDSPAFQLAVGPQQPWSPAFLGLYETVILTPRRIRFKLNDSLIKEVFTYTVYAGEHGGRVHWLLKEGPLEDYYRARGRKRITLHLVGCDPGLVAPERQVNYFYGLRDVTLRARPYRTTINVPPELLP